MKTTKKKVPVKKRNHPVPVKMYIEAFKKHFKCTEKDIEVKLCWDDGPLRIKFDDAVYEVDSHYDFIDHVKSMLTEQESAMHVPLNIWLEIEDGVHLEPDFWRHLL
jgi:hypothetical protein